MANWLEKYRASVAWGDLITAQHDYSRDGQMRRIECCCFPVDDSYAYVLPGTLANLDQAIADAVEVKASSACRVNVLFTDETATETQVEEAMTVLGQRGFGCRFLEAQPDVLHLGLLDRMSEGTIADRAVQLLQEGQADA